MKRLSFLFLLVGLFACNKEEVPTVTTTEVTNIEGTAAICGGTITNEGSSTVLSRGVCWSKDTEPTISGNNTVDGAGAGSFISTITGLEGGTKYFVRAFASNYAGTGYGMTMSFTTLGEIPSATSQNPSNITTTKATFNGIVNANHLSTEVYFEYGLTTSYGSIVQASINPVNGSTDIHLSVDISGLIKGISYHYRIVAKNSIGVVYGEDIKFTTYFSSVDDIDGNTYNVVFIGNQVWMADNLRVTKYRNGDIIGTTIPATKDISNELTPKYQWSINGDESTTEVYGRLYTWYAVCDNRNICPVGWHLPDETEWTTLVNYLGGSSVAGGKMKSTGTLTDQSGLWNYPNLGATNQSGFSATPAGIRGNSMDIFVSLGDYAHYFISNQSLSNTSIECISLSYIGQSCIINAVGKENGISVRCVKD